MSPVSDPSLVYASCEMPANRSWTARNVRDSVVSINFSRSDFGCIHHEPKAPA